MVVLDFKQLESGCFYKLVGIIREIPVEFIGVGLKNEPPVFDTIYGLVLWLHNTQQADLLDREKVVSLYFYELETVTYSPIDESSTLRLDATWSHLDKGFILSHLVEITKLEIVFNK